MLKVDVTRDGNVATHGGEDVSDSQRSERGRVFRESEVGDKQSREDFRSAGWAESIRCLSGNRGGCGPSGGGHRSRCGWCDGVICRMGGRYTEPSSTCHDDFLTGYDMELSRAICLNLKVRGLVGNEVLVREWE